MTIRDKFYRTLWRLAYTGRWINLTNCSSREAWKRSGMALADRSFAWRHLNPNHCAERDCDAL